MKKLFWIILAVVTMALPGCSQDAPAPAAENDIGENDIDGTNQQASSKQQKSGNVDMPPVELSADQKQIIEKIRQIIDRRIANRLAEQHRYHQEILKDDPDAEPSFEAFMGRLAEPCIVQNPASDEEIDALQTKAGVEIPPDVRLMYRTLGGWGGEFEGEMTATFHEPEVLIPDFADDAPEYSRLRGMGLHDMIVYCWGGRDDLTVESGFPQATIDKLNSYLCVGWFGDGYCESHAYIIQTGENRYSLFGWHQDYSIDPPTNDREMGLLELILTVLEANERLAVPDEDGNISVPVDALIKEINGECSF